MKLFTSRVGKEILSLRCHYSQSQVSMQVQHKWCSVSRGISSHSSAVAQPASHSNIRMNGDHIATSASASASLVSKAVKTKVTPSGRPQTDVNAGWQSTSPSPFVVQTHTLNLHGRQTNVGVNLNTGFLHFKTAADMYDHIRFITRDAGDFTVRNFVGVIESISPIDAAIVETDLFNKACLEYYTKKNLHQPVTVEETRLHQKDIRGGAQGDYADGMVEKIENVIACLKAEPRSKRATITIPFSSEGSKTANWKDIGQSKCVRELHFYVEDNLLKCTAILRMQNANIFPKNVHFIAAVCDMIAKELGVGVGEYTHWITNLCHDRDAVSC